MLGDKRYQGSIESWIDPFEDIIKFLESVSFNEKSKFENHCPNWEFIMEYRPVSRFAGQVILRDMNAGEDEIYIQGLVNRKHFISDFYSEVLKLYHSSAFKSFQNFLEDVSDKYTDIDKIKSDVIERYLKEA
jgi:hypothetical protein